MNDNRMEEMLVKRSANVPEDLRSQVLETIGESSRMQTRRDDLRIVLVSAISLALVIAIFYWLALVEHSRILQTIAAAGEPHIQWVEINRRNEMPSFDIEV